MCDKSRSNEFSDEYGEVWGDRHHAILQIVVKLSPIIGYLNDLRMEEAMKPIIVCIYIVYMLRFFHRPYSSKVQQTTNHYKNICIF